MEMLLGSYEFYVYKLETCIPKLETHIPKLETYIPKLGTKNCNLRENFSF